MIAKPRFYHAHETAREDGVDGLKLAEFWQRAVGFMIDFVLMLLIWAPVVFGWKYFITHKAHGSTKIEMSWNPREEESLIFLLAYGAVANYVGNGQTPGKWIARTRAVSLTHKRMGLWQSFERALAYGASFLEAGFGFVQFFMHRNRQTVHDRIAETIVVDVRKKAGALQGAASE
jgi:uncharacterized RDD family membrane protein YckC